MHIRIYSVARFGGRNRPVRVDVRLDAGLPSLTIIGATIGATRELAVRLRAALDECAIPWPLMKVIISVSPWGPPNGLGDIEFSVAVALIIASHHDQPGTDRRLDHAA